MFATRFAPTWRSYRRRRRGTAESAEFALLQAIGSADPSAKSCVTHRSRSPTGAATTIVAVGSLPRRKTFSVSGPVNNWIAPSAVASNHTSRDCGESGPPARTEPVHGAEELEVLGGQRPGVGADHGLSE